MADVRILVGDALSQLATLPDESVHCVVTSPPYWGLRAYKGDAGMIGLEPTFDEHLEALVAVFREVRRVLRADGTLWLNYGDAFDAKQLMLMPARVAMALQADGWWLRSEIVWHKPNPMPESVTDRPTSAHEKLFLLSKSARYFYDAEAVRVPWETAGLKVGAVTGKRAMTDALAKGSIGDAPDRDALASRGANLRNVWTLPTAPYSEAHFATFPPALVEPCVKAGCPKGGVVLDPFGGSGTVGLVADRLQRDAILIEISPEYAAMARKRIASEQGGLFEATKVGAVQMPMFAHA